MTLQAIPLESTADVMAGRLREAIIEGRFGPGDRLIEAELAHAFQTSRGPVREAMRTLASEGFVVLRKNRGAVVAAPTLADVREVYAIRESLGALAIQQALAEGPPSPEHMAEACALLGVMRETVHAAAMVQADLAFQSALLDLAGLPRISAIFRQTHQEVRFFVAALGIRYDRTDHDELIARHERIVGAMSSGDAAVATRAWRDHIHRTIDEFTLSVAAKESA